MNRLTVDRIEENIAVCMDENEALVGIELSCLPFDIKEGNIICLFDDGSIVLDTDAEYERRKELFDLQESLFDE